MLYLISKSAHVRHTKWHYVNRKFQLQKNSSQFRKGIPNEENEIKSIEIYENGPTVAYDLANNSGSNLTAKQILIKCPDL